MSETSDRGRALACLQPRQKTHTASVTVVSSTWRHSTLCELQSGDMESMLYYSETEAGF